VNLPCASVVGAVLVTVLAWPVGAGASVSEMRTWTDTSGQFSVEAEFVKLAPSGAQLRRADGVLILVPLQRLSQSDRDYVARIATAAPAPSIPTPPKQTPHGPGTLDLSYVPADSTVALIAYPARLYQALDLADLGLEKELEEWEQTTGLVAEDLLEIALYMKIPEQGSGVRELATEVMRFAKPVDVKQVIAGLSGVEMHEATIRGMTVFTSDPDRPGNRVCFKPDPRTIVGVAESRLPEVLRAHQAESPLKHRLAQLDTSAEIMIVVALEPMRKQIDAIVEHAKTTMSPNLAQLLEILRLVQSAVVTLNFSNEPFGQIVLQTGGTDEADRLNGLMQKALLAAETWLAAKRADIEATSPRGTVEAIDELLKGLSLRTDGSNVVVSLKRPENLNEFLLIYKGIQDDRARAREGELPTNEVFGPGEVFGEDK